MMPGLLALTAAAIFTGAAHYVRIAEQPARLTLKDDALLAEWKLSYKRGAAMQAPLALVSFFLGLLAWWQSSHPGFLMGAVLIVAPWPWTLLAIKPTNDALLETEPDAAGALTRMLIVRWGVLHGVRIAMGTLATAAYLWACASH